MKRILFTLLIFLLFTNCSHLIDAVWNPNTASFEATATGLGINNIRISFTKSDHNDYRSSGQSEKDKFFKAYYIYKSSDPYDGYSLVGMEAMAYNGNTDAYGGYFSEFREKKYLSGSTTETQGALNATSNRYYDDATGCPSGKTIFFRVISVYQEWDKNSNTWKSITVDGDKSNIASVNCP